MAVKWFWWPCQTIYSAISKAASDYWSWRLTGGFSAGVFPAVHSHWILLLWVFSLLLQIWTELSRLDFHIPLAAIFHLECQACACWYISAWLSILWVCHSRFMADSIGRVTVSDRAITFGRTDDRVASLQAPVTWYSSVRAIDRSHLSRKNWVYEQQNLQNCSNPDLFSGFYTCLPCYRSFWASGHTCWCKELLAHMTSSDWSRYLSPAWMDSTPPVQTTRGDWVLLPVLGIWYSCETWRECFT